jgi:hypothetical protein
VALTVHHRTLDEKDDDLLMVSNNPEVVKEEGLLFSGKVSQGRSARLLFYHINPSKKKLNLMTYLNNPTAGTLEVFVSEGLAGPGEDGLWAGHVAAMRFIKNLRSQAGRVIKIAPFSSYFLSDQLFFGPQRKAATGIFRVRLLTGQECTVNIASLKGDKQKLASLERLKGDETDSRVCGIINNPNVDLYKNYYTEDKYLSIPIGTEPTLRTVEEGKFLAGNYGVLHRIHINISNRRMVPEEVSLYYSSSGGLSRGIFLIDGKIYETGLLDPQNKREEKLLTLMLNPKEKKDLAILTMPQAGAYYPNQLVVWGSNKDLSPQLGGLGYPEIR